TCGCITLQRLLTIDPRDKQRMWQPVDMSVIKRQTERQRARLKALLLDNMTSVLYFFVFSFFFSSRRRHTRLVSDWSSDVCSSDLVSDHAAVRRHRSDHLCGRRPFVRHRREHARPASRGKLEYLPPRRQHAFVEIGRASCRERG